MKRAILLTLMTLPFTFASFAQEGTVFRAVPLKEALEAAAKEGKYVFVDCYTSWCGPCKNMTENIFPQKKVADFFNPQFVSVKYDIEKDEDGIKLAADFGITSIPTFLVLKPDGALVHKIVGGSSEADAFLVKAREIFDDERAYNSLKAISRNGGTDLTAAVESFTTVGDEKIQKLLQELLDQATPAEKTSPEFWFIYSTPRLSPKGSENEKFLFDNFEQFRKTVGRKEVDDQLGLRYRDLLKDIAEGRTEISSGQLARMLALVKRSNLDSGYNVMPYAKLSHALINSDMETLISIAEECAPAAGLWTYAIMYENAGKKGITPEQQQAWIAISEKLRPTLAKNQIDMLDPIIEGIGKRMEKRKQ